MAADILDGKALYGTSLGVKQVNQITFYHNSEL